MLSKHFIQQYTLYKLYFKTIYDECMHDIFVKIKRNFPLTSVWTPVEHFISNSFAHLDYPTKPGRYH